MAVTKRTRFEVLRRDKHTCQYCGEKSPDVALQIDHVVPVALGGDDKPSNLVTACRDCNAGKASIPQDSPIVQGLSERAAAYALGMVDKMTRFRQDLESLEDYEAEFRELWDVWGAGSGEDRKQVPLPHDYRMTLFRWKQMGIPISAYELAIPVAMLRHAVKQPDKFSYFAGVIWNMVNAREIDYSVTSDTAAVYTAAEAESYSDDSWHHGFDAGKRRGLAEARENEIMNDLLSQHIDNSSPFGEVNPFTNNWEFKGVKLVGTRQSEYSDGHLE